MKPLSVQTVVLTDWQDLYTQDMKKAIRIAERLEYGLIGINDTRIAAAKRPSEVLSKVVSVGNEAEKD
jgi:acyl-CoA reductase-like NAD-dependent aldehyde dehydrogenase